MGVMGTGSGSMSDRRPCEAREALSMCNWGDTIIVRLWVPAHLSHTGRRRMADKAVDRCIAPVVLWCNRHGADTAASCCGHGLYPASITLANGRVLGERIIKGISDGLAR